jgi:hypothetical protein
VPSKGPRLLGFERLKIEGKRKTLIVNKQGSVASTKYCNTNWGALT